MPWNIYAIPGCNKVSHFNYSSNVYAWDEQIASQYLPATVGCSGLVPFVISNSWMIWLQMGWYEERLMVTNASFTLFSKWHLHNVLQEGWAEVSCRDTSCCASDVTQSFIIPCLLFEAPLAMNQYIKLLFFYLNKTLADIYFSWNSLWFCQVSLWGLQCYSAVDVY